MIFPRHTTPKKEKHSRTCMPSGIPDPSSAVCDAHRHRITRALRESHHGLIAPLWWGRRRRRWWSGTATRIIEHCLFCFAGPKKRPLAFRSAIPVASETLRKTNAMTNTIADQIIGISIITIMDGSIAGLATPVCALFILRAVSPCARNENRIISP